MPLKAFLVTSAGTFAGIIGADHASRSYESARNPIDVEYRAREARQSEAERANKTFTQRAMDFGKKERYKIVGASWIASMATAFALVNRNKYLSGPQKLVQARVYAQFLTLGVLVASAAFEISDSKKQEGHWETVKYIDPKDPEHKRTLERKEFKEGESAQASGGDDMWKDMVAAEEERLKERDEEDAKFRKPKAKGSGSGNGNSKSRATETEKKDSKAADAKNAKSSKPDEKTDEKSGDASKEGTNHAEQRDESGKKTPRTGDGKDGEANTGGVGKSEGKDVKGGKKPVKGADEAKDKDGESTKSKK